jgi:P27 family predicted phage terminase small subunit
LRGGRPPKPTKLKLLQGSKIRGRKAEPKIPVGVPVMPAHLDGYAAAEWARQIPLLTQMRVLTIADIGALEILCLAYAEYREANDELKLGTTYETTTQTGDVMIRPRPEVMMRNDAFRRYRAMLVEFGLTPSARAKVSAAGEEEKESDFAAFMKRRNSGKPPQ